jgi:hypothetical protein
MPVVEFVAKPVTVRAIQWTGENLDEILRFCNNLAFMENGILYVETTEGTSRARVGYWIVQGTMGEFYPVRDIVMQEKYIRKEYKPYRERVIEQFKDEPLELD